MFMGVTKMGNFPLEKILTISETDYIGHHKEINPIYYDLVGIHFTSYITQDTCGRYAGELPSLKEEFAKQVPENAEVVLGFVDSVGGSESATMIGSPRFIVYIASGTALVPNDKYKDE